MTNSIKRALRNVGVVVLAALIIFGGFRLVTAGSLSPSVAPASTMNSLEAIYSPLVGTSYDSSGVTGSRTGNALEISKCIISKLAGSPCP